MACDIKSLISANACLFELSGKALRTVMFGAAQGWALTSSPGLDTSPRALIASNPCLMELSDAELRTVIFSTLCNIQGGGGGSLCADTDAQAFLTSAAISDSATINAICTFVTSLKTAGVWTLMDVIYPFVGGTSSSTSFNLKNPSAFPITWHAGVTFNANGVTGNGSTGYGDTGYNPRVSGVNYTQNSASLGFYVTGANPGINSVYIGSTDGVQPSYILFDGSQAEVFGLNSNTATSEAPSPSHGFYLGNRTASLECDMYVPGGVRTNGGAGPTTAVTNAGFYVLAQNNNGTPGSFSGINLSLAVAGAGLTPTQESALSTAATTLNTALGRS